VVRSAWGAPSYNPASRFLEEVPDELLDWRRVESSVTSTPAIAYAAARPTASSPGNRPVVSLVPGDRVTHDTFGMGTVVSVEGAGERAVASIDFKREGVKRLLLRYAPVEKL
jgi:DNA helicase-2/ATP-dependent DNA helicase PcrA